MLISFGNFLSSILSKFRTVWLTFAGLRICRRSAIQRCGMLVCWNIAHATAALRRSPRRSSIHSASGTPKCFVAALTIVSASRSSNSRIIGLLWSSRLRFCFASAPNRSSNCSRKVCDPQYHPRRSVLCRLWSSHSTKPSRSRSSTEIVWSNLSTNRFRPRVTSFSPKRSSPSLTFTQPGRFVGGFAYPCATLLQG